MIYLVLSLAVQTVHVFQVDTRYPSGRLKRSVDWNQEIAIKNGWRYSFVNVSGLCSSTSKNVPCPGTTYSPVWLKVAGMVHMANTAGQNVTYLFLDGDAVLSTNSRYTTLQTDIYFAKELRGWWTHQCQFANYTVCINSGVVIFKATATTKHILHDWWEGRHRKRMTPYERFRSKGKVYSTLKDWCWEQDHISDMLTRTPALSQVVGYVEDTSGRITSSPITGIVHYCSNKEALLAHATSTTPLLATNVLTLNAL